MAVLIAVGGAEFTSSVKGYGKTGWAFDGAEVMEGREDGGLSSELLGVLMLQKRGPMGIPHWLPISLEEDVDPVLTR